MNSSPAASPGRYMHPNLPGYRVVVKGWSAAQAQVSVTCDSAFTGTTYGLGGAESYGYNIGSYIKDVFQTIIVKNQFATAGINATCTKTLLNPSVSLPYQPSSLVWDFHGSFANITINSPTADSSYVLNSNTMYIYKLATNYAYNTAGSYQLSVKANNPSSGFYSGVNIIEGEVQVFEKPVADWSFLHTGCAADTVRFIDSSKVLGRQIIKWNWDFGDTQKDSVKNPFKLYAAGGDYPVKLRIVTDVGCVSDTTKMLSIAPVPIANFGVQLPTCVPLQVTFTDSSTVTSGNLTKWYWDYGNGQKDTFTTNAARIISYPVAGNYTVKLVVETTQGCKTLKTLLINIPGGPPSCLVSFCPGSNTNFASGNSAAGNTYQWQVDTGTGFTDIGNNAVYSGTASDTLKLNAPPSAWYGYKYRCLVNNAPSSPEFALEFSITWTGSVSDAWENSANWNCGLLPDGFTDVVVSAGLTNYPVVNVDTVCGSLRLAPGTTVRVMPGVKLEIRR